MERDEGLSQRLCESSTEGASLSYCCRCGAVRRNLTHFVNQIWKPSEADGGQASLALLM
jgi:hypothetical protein